MYVKFLRYHQGYNKHPGQCAEVPTRIGKALVAAGNAQQIDPPPEPAPAPPPLHVQVLPGQKVEIEEAPRGG
jgi:hypothetical protein